MLIDMISYLIVCEINKRKTVIFILGMSILYTLLFIYILYYLYYIIIFRGKFLNIFIYEYLYVFIILL